MVTGIDRGRLTRFGALLTLSVAVTAFNLGDSDPRADLAAAMRRNPDLRIMTIEGWFGAVGTAHYGIAKRRLPRDRVTGKAYHSGHMPYVGHAEPLMAADLKDFIVRASLPATRPAQS